MISTSLIEHLGHKFYRNRNIIGVVDKSVIILPIEYNTTGKNLIFREKLETANRFGLKRMYEQILTLCLHEWYNRR